MTVTATWSSHQGAKARPTMGRCGSQGAKKGLMPLRVEGFFVLGPCFAFEGDLTSELEM